MAGSRLSLPMVRDLLDDVKALDFEIVRLYGGEPLVHEQINEIVEYCARLRLHSYLTTNGILLKKNRRPVRRRSASHLYWPVWDRRALQRVRGAQESVQPARGRHRVCARALGSKVELTLGWLLMKPTCSIDTVRETWQFAVRYNAPIFINFVHYSLPYFTEGEDRELALRKRTGRRSTQSSTNSCACSVSGRTCWSHRLSCCARYRTGW